MKLSKPIIVAVDGISGSGKSTAANIIGAKLGGRILRGDPLLFEFIRDNPRVMKEIFGRGSAGMDSFEYFLKHCFQSTEQYVELLDRARPYIEEQVYGKIQSFIKNPNERVRENFRGNPTVAKAIVFDYATSSTMYPWKSADETANETAKVLVTAGAEESKIALMKRESLVDDAIPRILAEGQAKLIRPQDADFVIHNTHKGFDGMTYAAKKVGKLIKFDSNRHLRDVMQVDSNCRLRNTLQDRPQTRVQV